MKREIKHCWCGAIAEGSTDQCGTHNAEDRKNARHAQKTKTIRQVQKVTLKRANQNQEYMKLRHEYLLAYPVCEVEDCQELSVDIHHQKGKENDLLLDTNYFFAVCRPHHTYYTEHSKEAIAKGISVSRTSKTE